MILSCEKVEYLGCQLGGEDRCQHHRSHPAHHNAVQLLAVERTGAFLYLVCDDLGADYMTNQNAGEQRHDRHEHGVGDKVKEIEELKAERLNRKRRLQEKEAKQARNKKRRKSKGSVMIFIIVALLIAIVSVIIGYNMMAPNDNGLGTAPTSTNSPASATNTPTDTANNVSSTSSPSNSASKNGYSKMTISGVTCVYPSTFNSNPTTGNQKLNLTDALGGATTTVPQEGKSGAPSDLMRDYARQTGGEVSYSRAGDDWYAVTVTTDDTVYHRKCVLKNGIAVYYDFSYSSMTSTAQKYTEYIDYMDSNFK